MQRWLVPCLTIALLGALPSQLAAETAKEKADQLNEEGKRLFADKQYEEALGKFRDAVVLSAEGRFYFNICFTLNSLERYAEAIEACENVERNGANQALLEKTNKALTSLRSKVAEAQPGPTPPPGTEPPVEQPATTAVPPVEEDPFAQATASSAPVNDYAWALGAALGGLRNFNIGKRDGLENYAGNGGHIKLFANFLLSEQRPFGVQGSINITTLNDAEDNFRADRLTVADFGAGAFWDFRLTRKLYVSPLLGLHVSVLTPGELSQGFVAVGGRAEATVAYVLGGSRWAISLAPSLNLYGPASGSSEGTKPVDFALDKASTTFAVCVGLQYRIPTPFGSTPLFQLE